MRFKKIAFLKQRKEFAGNAGCGPARVEIWHGLQCRTEENRKSRFENRLSVVE
jgi:hypothetical protein